MSESKSEAKGLETPKILYPPLARVRKSGSEKFHCPAGPLKISLSDFWGWSVSDLVSNATRGRLAEFIVASAIGIDLGGVRDEWGPFDLKAPWGLTIEVKSAAYIQTWAQWGFSPISFSTRKSRAWDSELNVLSKDLARQAECYVFALLAHRDRESIDPLDVSQWEFFVLATTALNDRTRSQHSITYKSLKAMSSSLTYFQLRSALEAIPTRSAT